MAIPQSDVQLAPYATHFDEKLVASGVGVYKIAAPLISAFSDLRRDYTDAVTNVVTARQNGVESKPLLLIRESARVAMLPTLRNLYNAISVNPEVSDAAKVEIGVNVRRQPSRRPAPIQFPNLKVKGINQNLLTLLAQGESDTKRSLPAGVSGMTLFSYEGTTPPTTAAGWTWHGNFSRAQAQLAFDASIEGTVWVCGVFYNDRGQGPASPPIMVKLAGGNAVPSAQQAMKIAA